MYHFFSGAAVVVVALDEPSLDAVSDAPPSAGLGSPSHKSLPATLSIDQLRQVGPHQVEDPQDDRGDDRHDDDDYRRRADFLGGWPGDFLELARNFVGEVVDA